MAVDKRLRILYLSGDYVRSFGLADLRAIELLAHCVRQGLPQDATIDAIQEDILRDRFVLRIRSAEFDPVPEGWVIPEIVLRSGS